jgi:hypothetical protein
MRALIDAQTTHLHLDVLVIRQECTSSGPSACFGVDTLELLADLLLVHDTVSGQAAVLDACRSMAS